MERGNKQFLTENPILQNNLAVNITLFGVYRIKDSRNSNRRRRGRMGRYQSLEGYGNDNPSANAHVP